MLTNQNRYLNHTYVKPRRKEELCNRYNRFFWCAFGSLIFVCLCHECWAGSKSFTFWNLDFFPSWNLLVDQSNNKKKTYIQNQPSKNGRDIRLCEWFCFFRHTFNLCIAHELSCALEPMPTIKTAPFFLPISTYLSVSRHKRTCAVYNPHTHILFPIHFYSPLWMICIWLQRFW